MKTENPIHILEITYPQKMHFWIEFPLSFLEIHNSMDWLEDRWETILEVIRTSLSYLNLQILKEETEIDANFTKITCELVVLAHAPSLNLTNLVINLHEIWFVNNFKIFTTDKFNSNTNFVIYQTT